MFTREMDASIGEQVERRLREVDRALRKIEEGTYGLSDDSGEPIPRGRLEAIPERARTVEEQQRFEQGRAPPRLEGKHLRRYNLSMDHRSSGGETREPIFRSDLEGPRPEPRYEPLRPEGGLWSVIKRWVAPLAAVGLVLAKFKGPGASPSQGQVPGHGADHARQHRGICPAVSRLVRGRDSRPDLGARDGSRPAAKTRGHPASAPMFIPFLGAFVAMKQMPKDALAEARVGLAGPVLGTLGGLATLGSTPPRGSRCSWASHTSTSSSTCSTSRRCSRSTAAGPSGRCPRSSSCSGSS